MNADRTLVVDIDGTIAGPAPARDYAACEPITRTILRLRKARAAGWRIVLHTARGMRTYAGDIQQIEREVLPVIEEWLQRHDVPYDELIVGKPWPGADGYYVDDRAIRPSEFARLSDKELSELVARESDPDSWSQE